MKTKRSVIPLWLLCAAMLPAVVQAQFNYTITNGTITITGYIGTNTVVTIPDAINVAGTNLPVTNIGDWAFHYCRSLTSVTMGTNVTNIGDYAFWECFSLTSVTIPKSVTSIGVNAFYGCTSLTSVTTTTNVTNIGDGAFGRCSSLTYVTIPNSVTNIGDEAFSGCTSLTSIYFQGNVPNLGSDVFDFCPVTIYYLPGTTGWDEFSAITGLPTALWLPHMQPGGTTFGIQSNQFGFNINWASGPAVVIEASSSLSHPAWSPVATNTLDQNGTSYFSDPQWTNYPSRFYRVRSP